MARGARGLAYWSGRSEPAGIHGTGDYSLSTKANLAGMPVKGASPKRGTLFAGLPDIGLQQNARLQQPLRRALSFADQRLQMLAFPALKRTTYFFTEMSFPAMPASVAKSRPKQIIYSFQIS